MSNVDKIRINEAYRDYVPPISATKVVRRLLRTVPEKYLVGLSAIVLTSESSLSRRDRVGKVRSRKRKYDRSLVAGLYHGSWANSPAWIELRVDKIISESGPIWSRVPLVQSVVFGRVLFHEIGHHIHFTIRPEHKEKEDVADNWSRKLSANFFLKHYWYALPVLVPAAKLYKYMRARRWI